MRTPNDLKSDRGVQMSGNSYFMGHWLTNLIIPGEPPQFEIDTPAGQWKFNISPNYEQVKDAISQGKIGETYSIECAGTYTESRDAAIDRVASELIPICLGASYLTALSVIPCKSLPGSDVSFIQPGPHFPRPRAMGEGFQSATDTTMFVRNIETFVSAYPNLGSIEKIRLISHHFLDALAFWSIEDLVLSTTTILEIISITSKSIAAAQGQTIRDFKQRMSFAANRFSLPDLPADFREMRNDLVHEGTLSGTQFPGRSPDQCGKAAAEALDWIDQYIFAALGMGQPGRARFVAEPFRGVNTFSL
jgi:hypothetical protein